MPAPRGQTTGWPGGMAATKRAFSIRPGAEKAVLGVDMGSTFTRLSLFCPTKGDRGQNYPVELPSGMVDHRKLTTNNTGEFPTVGCPLHEDWAKLIGAQALHYPESYSLKYFIYILAIAAGGSRQMLKEYPHFGELVARMDEPELQARLKKSLVTFFGMLREIVESRCHVENIYFEEVALCIPPQWSESFQKVYLEVFCQAFDRIKKANIFFIHESEAIGHYIIHTRPHKVHGAEKVMIIDNGGHCMNGCSFDIAWSEENASFFQRGDSFWASGGSGLWTYLAGKEIEKRLKREDPAGDLNTEWWSEMVRDFERAKADFGNGQASTTALTKPRAGGTEFVHISIEYEQMRKCYDKAFKEPLRMTKEMIKRASRQLGDQLDKLCVVFTGGSALNKALQQTLTDTLPPPLRERAIWTQDIETRYRGHNTSMGAAIAVANRASVSQFMERGSVIGLQIGPITDRRGWPDWQPDALVLLDKGHASDSAQRENSGYRKVSLEHESRLLLVCDPLGRSQHRDLGGDHDTCNATISIKYCYNLFGLGLREAGTYYFKLTYVEGDDDWRSILRVDEIDADGIVVPPNDLPMYFDGGHNCIHVDIDALPDGQVVEVEEPVQTIPRIKRRLNHDHDSGPQHEQQVNHDRDLDGPPHEYEQAYNANSDFEPPFPQRHDHNADYAPPKKAMKMKRGGKR